MRWKTAVVTSALAALVVSAALAVPQWTASASDASSGAKSSSTSPPLCRTPDISYYYGDYEYGLGARSFVLTLVAHDGVRCALPDQPLLHLSPPYGHKRDFTVTVLGGQGGTLILSPKAPLHTTLSYYAPDTTDNTTYVHSLTLDMPGGGHANSEWFLYPGDVAIARNRGVQVTAWATGLEAGQEATAY